MRFSESEVCMGVNIKRQEVGMYPLLISTEECFNEVYERGGKRIELFLNCTDKKPIVYQDPNGLFQMFLYLTPDERTKAYDRGKELGFVTLAYSPTLAYVDAEYLKGVL